MSTPSLRTRATLLAVAIAIAGSASALAQIPETDYAKLSSKVHQADTLFVTTRTEGEIRGRLLSLTPEAISVSSEQGERTIALSDVGWIERRGDLLWNGALIGGAILGFGMMGAAGASCSPNCGSQVPAALAIGVAEGAAVGALIDRLIPGRRLVYGKRLDKSRRVLERSVPADAPRFGPAGVALA